MPRILILSRHIDSASFRQRIALYFKSLEHAGIKYNVEPIPPKLWKTLRLFANTGDFDAVLLHKKRLSPIQGFLLRRNAKKIIYDFDDAVMFDHKYPQVPHSKKLKRFADTVKMADNVIAGNSFLADFAKKFNDNTTIIPTGLDTAEYNIDKKQSTDDKIRLVWIGSGSNLLYLKQIRETIEQIGKKHKDVVLRVICNEFFSLRNMPIEKLQWSLQTQIPDLINSDIGIAPLPNDNFAKGKCGFKILQYCAASMPVVASPVGVNSELIRHGINGFLAETPSQWSENLSRLIVNPDLRRKMGQEAGKLAKNYDVSVLEKKFVSTILNTLSHNES